MSAKRKPISPEANQEFQRLLKSLETAGTASRIWQRVLSPEERKQFRTVKGAFRRFGVVNCWMRLRKVSVARAVVELAMHLNVADRNTANWLLREFDEPELEAISSGKRSPPSPSWNKDKRELHFGEKLARRVPRPKQAKNVARVLDAFEEQHWPPRIDDPLPGGRDSNRLNRTITVLNSGLRLIRFHADGTAEGISWSTGR
jgi:hypothetical protein